MNAKFHRRFKVELALGILSAMSLLLTLLVPNWIEYFFGFEPDGGDGSTEWGLALALCVTTVACLVSARRTWKRLAVGGPI